MLVVEDEPRIASFVSRALRARGWMPEVVNDGPTALRLAVTGSYTLIVLDLVIPGMDGTEVLRRVVAARPEQKVIVLSGRSETQTKVRCLELGAADYLVKPFSVEELLARINLRLREQTPVDRFLQRSGVALDMERRKARGPQGEVSLTEREFLLLAHLMREEGRVFSREELLSEVWGFSFDPGSNVVDVYIRRLRNKLGGDAIQTIRNVGYTLRAG